MGELLKLVDKLNSPNTFKPDGQNNTDKDNENTYINLDSDFIPLIENIKTNLFDLINFEGTFVTKSNLYLAKDNIIEKIKSEKEAKEINEDSNNSNKIEEENYYNEKINLILFNIMEIKKLANSKDMEKNFKLKRPSANKNNNNNNNDTFNEIKFYIYSRYEDMEKFLFDLSRTLRININRVEDIENIKFTKSEEKINLIRNLEKKLTDSKKFAYKLSLY